MTSPADGAPRRPTPADLRAVAGYLAGAVFVFGRLWRDPAGQLLSDNLQDYTQFEWVLAHAARSVTHLENPLITYRLNSPDGVNMMANTSMLGATVPLTPVTLLFGPAVALVLLLTLALAGTATAWYCVLSRHVVRSRTAAFVGGAFCGFAPGMISHANAHPNLIAQFLLPLLLWRIIRLREPGRSVRNGLVVGLLVVYQAFLNEELLFVTALAFAVFLAAYAPCRPAEIRQAVRPFLRGIAVAVAAAVPLLAYPLWVQFFGPQHYHGLPAVVAHYSADLASFPAYSRASLAGHAEISNRIAQGPTEENAFFGWPLLALAVVIVIWLRREPVVRALAVTGGVFALFSLGSSVVLNGQETGIRGPWWLLEQLPVFDLVLTARLALVTAASLGILLAISLDRALAVDPAGFVDRALAVDPPGVPVRLLWWGAVLAALLPLAPTPLPVADRPAVPHFITAGTWRRYVQHDDQTLVPMPLGWWGELNEMRWAAQQRLEFRIPNGYFLGPDPLVPGQTLFGTRQPPTSELILEVERSDLVPAIGDSERQQARADLRRWNAAIVVVPADNPHVQVLRRTLDLLLGTGQLVDDVWLWDVRNLSG